MSTHPHYWTLAAVAVGFVVIGHALSQRRRSVASYKRRYSSSAADLPPPLPPPQPRVLVTRHQGGAPEAVRTGASFFSALAVNPTADCAQVSGGHRLEGVTVAEQLDGTFLLERTEVSATATDSVSLAMDTGSAVASAAQMQPTSSTRLQGYTPSPNVLWRSKLLPLENSAAWHSDGAGLMKLPTKYPYCRASACVLALHPEEPRGGGGGEGGSVLLTRRRRDLRTFPGAWVLPGGGVDAGESLVACAQRELEEETGLVVSPDDLEPLCLWESFYPTSPADCFAAGTIGAHHLVVFFVAHLANTTASPSDSTQAPLPSSSSCPAVTLQPSENDAFVWIPPAGLPAFCEDCSRNDESHESRIGSNNDISSKDGVSSGNMDTRTEACTVEVIECLFPRASASGTGMYVPTSGVATTTTGAPSAAPAVAVRAVEVSHLARQYSSAVAAVEGTLAAGTAEAHRFALREFAARFS